MHPNTPDSSGKPAGCAAPEDLERIAGKRARKRAGKRARVVRIAGIGPRQIENGNENENELEEEQERQARVKTMARR